MSLMFLPTYEMVVAEVFSVRLMCFQLRNANFLATQFSRRATQFPIISAGSVTEKSLKTVSHLERRRYQLPAISRTPTQYTDSWWRDSLSRGSPRGTRLALRASKIAVER
jgi:hypothetical protein